MVFFLLFWVVEWYWSVTSKTDTIIKMAMKRPHTALKILCRVLTYPDLRDAQRFKNNTSERELIGTGSKHIPIGMNHAMPSE